MQQLTPTVRMVVTTHTMAVLMKYWEKLALSQAALNPDRVGLCGTSVRG